MPHQWNNLSAFADKRDIERDPFKGIGKPEPLNENWAGYWSRRIDQEHRLIYKVSDSQILIAKCKGHY